MSERKSAVLSATLALALALIVGWSMLFAPSPPTVLPTWAGLQTPTVAP